MQSSWLLASLPAIAWSHGWFVNPVPNQPGALGYYMGGQKTTHLSTSSTGKGNATCYGNKEVGTPFDPKSWYTNRVQFNGENPYYNLGQAKPWSSCGVLHHGGSDDTTCDVDKGNDPWTQMSKTSKGGKTACDGRKLVGKSVAPTIWPQGSVQEVAWAVCANHEGGVAYRLCPVESVTQDSEATEACFQSHQLDFSDDITVIRFSDGKTKDKEFQNVAVLDKWGKQWKESIIPHSCDGKDKKFKGGCGDVKQDFPDFSQVDHVRVPDLPAGRYALSWRWDCKLTPQIWSNCADIEIVEPTPEPTPQPTPEGGCSFQTGGTVDKNQVNQVTAESEQECCALCTAQTDCTHFTFVTTKNVCTMRSGVPEYNDAKNRISGELMGSLASV